MSTWIQFTVWKEKWPKSAITDFLPAFREIIGPLKRWHFLYEPYLLIRVDNMYESSAWDLFDRARALAQTLGYQIEFGDKARSSPSGNNDFFYAEDAKFYGSESLWQANLDMLWKTSELMLVLQREGKLGFPMLRKHTHLFCNAAGLNYIQSVWFWLKCAAQDFKCFLKYGLE